ncbi:coiled-coil domain-containing protein 1-like isoform X1 [Hydractinia symbiolongicarpus]|uniref:coiled-coil domain-containing protein 1-like isoform X1 n=1 Tax=Hydractinia symbiolongicarpus TaxID=13093 RepID=UPI00254A1337|nr:coiled-coil domain-containing protein 1-like isoform X1 [Hydractinia symbiolongicarpus]
MKFAVILATLFVVSLGAPIYKDEYNTDRLAEDEIDGGNAAVESDTHKSIDLAARESDQLNNGWGDSFSFSEDSQEDASSVNDAENTSDNVEYDLDVQDASEDMLDDVDDVLEENADNLENDSEDMSDAVDDASENDSNDEEGASENESDDIEDASEDASDDVENAPEDVSDDVENALEGEFDDVGDAPEDESDD